MKNNQTEIWEPPNKISDLKNSVDGHKSRLDSVAERIREPKDRVMEAIQTEAQRFKNKIE